MMPHGEQSERLPGDYPTKMGGFGHRFSDDIPLLHLYICAMCGTAGAAPRVGPGGRSVDTKGVTMGQKWVEQIPGEPDQLYKAAVEVVARNGWAVTQAFPETGVLTFHAPKSFLAARGITLTATFLPGQDDTTGLVVSGPLDAIAAFGSQGRTARRFLDGVKGSSAPGGGASLPPTESA